MSLSGAIQSLRGPVPSVPSPKNLIEPPEAAPAVAVLSVPPVPSEKIKTHGKTESGTEGENLGENGRGAKNQNGEVSESSISWNRWNQGGPLTEREFIEAITGAARQFKLSPATLWSFLSLEDIAAIREGSPENIGALWAFAESRSLTGDTLPGGHGLPFPGAAEEREGLPLVRRRKDIEPRGGPMHPEIERP